MGKRKLTRQQARRVGKNQSERARRATELDEQSERVLRDGTLGPEQEGLVTANYGSQVAVEGATGETQRCHLRSNLEGLVTGDKVVWCAGEDTGIVVARLARESVLTRPDAQGNLRPVAANIDQILVVIAPRPEPYANLIDRYLVAAETSHIEPVIVLNKIDIVEQEPETGRCMEALLAPYRSLGYRVLQTSANSELQDELRATLAGRTSIFVGQSGVGKSSLINSLVPEADLRTGALSEAEQKGTHTTTAAHLIHLTCGGALIDSPGIREFGLWHLDRETVQEGYREFRPRLGHCRFRDCQHKHEPGCAILAGVESGDITQRRLDSYRHIIADSESQEKR